MSRRRHGRNRRHRGLKTVGFLIVVLLAILGVLVAGGDRIQKAVKQKAAAVVLDKVSQETAGQTSGDTSAVEEIVTDLYQNMDQEDQQKVQEIIADNVDGQTISDVQGYVQSGDTKGLKEYVEQNLSAEDSAELQSLYEKYKDQLGQ